MSLFLLAGIATLDIINTVDHYPAEDEELRASARRISAGGNALNAARVLAGLGHRAELLALLADDDGGGRIRAELDAERVGHRYAPLAASVTPTSYVALSAANGSRTIIHYRDLPELRYAHFRAVPIERFDWLHFEGRNVAETEAMLRHARKRLLDQPISLEIEKPRPDIERLMPYADVLIFSRAYALARGHTQAAELLAAMRPHAPRASLVCAWGEAGAWALATNRQLAREAVHAPAVKAGQTVDTLGAGDAFNAGLIAALATGATLDEALARAVALAGHKVTAHGFAHLGKARPS